MRIWRHSELWRLAMPYTPEEVAQIRSTGPSHPDYYELGNVAELPQNTPVEKQSPTPEYLYRGLRVKGPIRERQLHDLLKGGLGQHWSASIQNAAAFGDPDNHDESYDYPGAANYPGPKDTGLIFTIRHPGTEYATHDPDGMHWHDEYEHTIKPDTPVQITQVHVKHPELGSGWTSLPHLPGEHRT